MSDALIDSLARAVAAAPQDPALRLHLAELLIAAGRGQEAVGHCATVLAQDPGSAPARELMSRALGPVTPAPVPDLPAVPDGPEAAGRTTTPARVPEPEPELAPGPGPSRQDAGPPDQQAAAAAPGGAAASDATRAEAPDSPDPASQAYDWNRAEEDLKGPPDAFVTSDDTSACPTDPAGSSDQGPAARQLAQAEPTANLWEVEDPGVALQDVGGMDAVKARLEVSFLAPMRNPELRRMYGKSLKGGLLLYGPPGCGKTFVARAVAGEMGASFLNVTLSDILNMYLGESEKNLHGVFQTARHSSPAVIFFDELDAIGLRRSTSLHSGAMRGVLNQLLQEMDGVGAQNEGIYVLAATNTPWDIDPALLRPGRLDRAVAVLPPDAPAREAILYHNLRHRPCEGIDLRRLAAGTEGYTGADLSHVCTSAAEYAMMDSVRTGAVRRITMADLVRAVAEIRPSTQPWFDTARTILTYGNSDNRYAELAEYMRAHRLL